MEESAETRNLVLSVCQMKHYGDVPPPCCAAQCVTLGVRMYCFGGANEVQSFGDIYVFEIAREHWIKLKIQSQLRPSARYGHSLDLWNDSLIVFGGMEQTEDEIMQNEISNYPPPPCIPSILSAQENVRSWHHRGQPCNSLYVFNTLTSEWTSPKIQGPFPSARSFHASVIIPSSVSGSSSDNSKLLIYGGSPSALFDTELNDAYILDLVTWTWLRIDTQLGTIPSPRFGHKIVYSANRETLYLFGGDGASDTYGTLYAGQLSLQISSEENNVLSGSSSRLFLNWNKPKIYGTSPLKRKFFSFAIIGDTLYVISGLTEEPGFSDFYVFDLNTSRWLKPLYEYELNTVAPAYSILVDKILLFGGFRSTSLRSAALLALDQAKKNKTGAAVNMEAGESKLSRHLCFLSVLQLKNMMSNAIRFKLVTVGDSGVGKSCLLQRFTQDIYNDHNVSTIGVDFCSVPTMVSGRLVVMQMWDTAGQERYSGVTGNYYRNADGFVIVYDVTNAESFEHVLNWLKQIKEHHDLDQNTFKLLIGNKQDLVSKAVVKDAEAMYLADSIGAIYLGTSAKTGAGVDTAFLLAARKILDMKKAKTNNENLASRIALESQQGSFNMGGLLSKCC